MSGSRALQHTRRQTGCRMPSGTVRQVSDLGRARVQAKGESGAHYSGVGRESISPGEPCRRSRAQQQRSERHTHGGTTQQQCVWRVTMLGRDTSSRWIETPRTTNTVNLQCAAARLLSTCSRPGAAAAAGCARRPHAPHSPPAGTTATKRENAYFGPGTTCQRHGQRLHAYVLRPST